MGLVDAGSLQQLFLQQFTTQYIFITRTETRSSTVYRRVGFLPVHILVQTERKKAERKREALDAMCCTQMKLSTVSNGEC